MREVRISVKIILSFCGWFSAPICFSSLSHVSTVKVENISGWVGDGWLVKKCNETTGNWWYAFCGSQATGQERQFTSGRTAGNSNPHHLDLCDFIIFIVTNSERNMNRAGCKWKWAGFSIEWIVRGALAGTCSGASIWYQPASHELPLRWSGCVHETTTEKKISQARKALLKNVVFQIRHLESGDIKLPDLHLRLPALHL